MIALYIVGGIALLLCLLAFLRVELTVVYTGELRFYLHVPGLSVRVFDSGKPFPLQEALRLLSYLTRDILGRFFRALRIRVARLHIAVATGDAAATALLYAGVSTAVAELATHLDSTSTLRSSCRSDVEITADFTGEKTRADVELGFSLLLYQAVILLCKYLRSLRKHQKKEKAEKGAKTKPETKKTGKSAPKSAK